ncbi:hypothetical protein Y1Q_0014215 [Alligator mississippiensis]|uniref:Uncharacterized protein n=1 Tax=Alligator mississippiensis TaxID=8496 RepID=A0A151MU29_ALLMI|nr:hypothetical protein Y1Q_0014215 [Alligator mississippiensis]
MKLPGQSQLLTSVLRDTSLDGWAGHDIDSELSSFQSSSSAKCHPSFPVSWSSSELMVLPNFVIGTTKFYVPTLDPISTNGQ